MIPERRLDRAERLLMLVIKAGYRERREWRQQSREQNEKINMIINAHIEAAERMDKLEIAQARTEKVMAELAEEHKATDRSLKAFQRAARGFLEGLQKDQDRRSSG